MRDASIVFTLVTMLVAIILWILGSPSENILIMAPGWGACLVLARSLVQNKA